MIIKASSRFAVYNSYPNDYDDGKRNELTQADKEQSCFLLFHDFWLAI